MKKLSVLALIASLSLAAPALAQTPADIRNGRSPSVYTHGGTEVNIDRSDRVMPPRQPGSVFNSRHASPSESVENGAVAQHHHHAKHHGKHHGKHAGKKHHGKHHGKRHVKHHHHHHTAKTDASVSPAISK